MSTQEHKWDQRWRDSDPTSGSVVAMADAWLPDTGRVLDLAGGVSGDALRLARGGLEVTVADISLVGLAQLSELATKAGLSITTTQVDLESEPMPAGPWDVITVGNFFAPEILSGVAHQLAPGGVVAVVVATRTNLERNAHPSQRFLAEPGQIEQVLLDSDELQVVHYSEAWRANGRHEAHAVFSRSASLSIGKAKARWRRSAADLRPEGFEIPVRSSQLCSHLVAGLEFAPGQRVIVYEAMATEATLAEAITHWGPERLAVTRTPEEGPLTVHPYDAVRETHRYGYSQPHIDAPVLPLTGQPYPFAAVLVPALVFDRHGGRLGRGRGYYDQLLARLDPETKRVGIAFDHMVLDRVPTEPHDVAMTHLATESAFGPVG